jgi:hypothetical protein
MNQLATYLLLLSMVLGKITFSQNTLNVKSEDNILINFSNYKYLGLIDDRFQSYNIEMASVIGGKFWKPYVDMKTQPKSHNEPQSGAEVYQTLPPIDLYNSKLRTLANGLAPAYVRVSGSWATSTFFQDNDESKLEQPPKGFANVLTRGEWRGVIDFIKATNSKLIISFAGSTGVRDKNGVWTPIEANKLIRYTRRIGGKIYAAQLFNEPNILAGGYPMPNKYTAEDYSRDVNAFMIWAKNAMPATKIHGPGNTAEGLPGISLKKALGANALSSDEMMSTIAHPIFDIFSFHFYGAVSMRSGDRAPWSVTFDSSLSNRWLSRIDSVVAFNIALRNKYLPNAPLWDTETAQASWGGDPWAADFIDIFRYLHQLGVEAKMGVKVNIHNTLESSEYSLIDRKDFTPKPNYWAALLWAKLMGKRVYDVAKQTNGTYLFVHSLKGSACGKTLLVINTKKKPIKIKIPSRARQYTLTSNNLKSKHVMLNGKLLNLTNNDQLPIIHGKRLKAGIVILPMLSVSFLTFK